MEFQILWIVGNENEKSNFLLSCNLPTLNYVWMRKSVRDRRLYSDEVSPYEKINWNVYDDNLHANLLLCSYFCLTCYFKFCIIIFYIILMYYNIYCILIFTVKLIKLILLSSAIVLFRIHLNQRSIN